MRDNLYKIDGKPDYWRIMTVGLVSNEIECGSGHKNTSVKHKASSDVQNIETETSLASSSSGYISAESLE